MSKRISRATFLLAGAGVAVSALSGKVLMDLFGRPAPLPPARLLGPAMVAGHSVRDGHKLPPLDSSLNREAKVAIVGGGIAGLSAAWWLKRQGFNDFVVLEMEKHVGGNSAHGANQISSYPWGAHYVPLANDESEYVHMLFEEAGITKGKDAAGRTVYNEMYLCHDPQERLYKDGTFEEGLVPRKGLQPSDKEQIARFFKLVKDLRYALGQDGKPAFAIPLELSSSDPTFRKFDAVSMKDWMKSERFDSRPLCWYINYCCRDDYGSSVENVSAWAGLHYFAGRRGIAANAEANSVVTWPEGNGFLVKFLKSAVKDHIKGGVTVARVVESDKRHTITCSDPVSKRSFEVDCDAVIMCAPRFVANHLVHHSGDALAPGKMLVPTYAPWMVANISLKHPPHGLGSGLAWDNVRYNSDSLGYVVATHQNISTRQGPTVITYYHPLSAETPKVARASLACANTTDWSERILADLERMHPGIREDVISIDLWPWGHGMVRPSVGFIWGDQRKAMKNNVGKLFFAHSDMSGISNFEEAQYQGVEAAKRVLLELGASRQS